MLAALWWMPLGMVLATSPEADGHLLDPDAELRAAVASAQVDTTPLLDEHLLDPQAEMRAPLPEAMDPRLAAVTMIPPSLTVEEMMATEVMPDIAAVRVDVGSSEDVAPLLPPLVDEGNDTLLSEDLSTVALPLPQVEAPSHDALPLAMTTAGEPLASPEGDTTFEALPPSQPPVPVGITRPEPLELRPYQAPALVVSRGVLSGAALVGVGSFALGVASVVAANLAWMQLRRGAVPDESYSNAAFLADAGFVAGAGLFLVTAICVAVGGAAMASAGVLDALEGPEPAPRNGSTKGRATTVRTTP
ncbi:MAG: hypothetical protein AB2A00_23055 [Myxococcota bacterium]